jgi:hypothetical protein
MIPAIPGSLKRESEHRCAVQQNLDYFSQDSRYYRKINSETFFYEPITFEDNSRFDAQIGNNKKEVMLLTRCLTQINRLTDFPVILMITLIYVSKNVYIPRGPRVITGGRPKRSGAGRFRCIIMKGQRPSVSSIEREHKEWVLAISNWLKENIKERISMNEFLGEMERLRPNRVTVNSKRRERKEKKEEVKEKQPTLTKDQ